MSNTHAVFIQLPTRMDHELFHWLLCRLKINSGGPKKYHTSSSSVTYDRNSGIRLFTRLRLSTNSELDCRKSFKFLANAVLRSLLRFRVLTLITCSQLHAPTNADCRVLGRLFKALVAIPSARMSKPPLKRVRQTGHVFGPL